MADQRPLTPVGLGSLISITSTIELSIDYSLTPTAATADRLAFFWAEVMQAFPLPIQQKVVEAYLSANSP